MRFIEKTKRRQRHVKTVKSKGRFTILRICELRVLLNARETEVGDGKFKGETDGELADAPGTILSNGESVEETDGELVDTQDIITSKGEPVEVKL